MKQPTGDNADGFGKDGRTVSIREATIEDSGEVSPMLARLGLRFPAGPAEARRYWRWLWTENPASSQTSDSLTLGWVLEADGEAVGFFGNLHTQYKFGDGTLLVAVGTSVAVDRKFRRYVTALGKHYWGQPRGDLWLGTTVGQSAPLCARFGMVPMPQAEYNEVLYWVLNSGKFLKAVLRRRNINRRLVTPGALATTPLLGGIVHFQRRRAGGGRRNTNVDVIAIHEIGEEFDELWRRKSSDGRLYAYRRAADLRWHFARHAQSGNLAILRCRRAGSLAGYVIMIREESRSIGLVRAKIVDLFVADDEPSVIAELFSAADREARHRGCHVLEVVGLPGNIRAQLKTWKPFSRQFPTFPVRFKARSAALQTALLRPDAWYLTLYDGDSSLF